MPKKHILDPHSQLTSRQKTILFAIVKEYCDNGINLGSKEIKQKYGFGFSSATIRNEISILRNLGYLYQPFLNSSSKPTDKAFKLFITQLIGGLQVTSQQQKELRAKLDEMEKQHLNLTQEISRLIAVQGGGAAFSLKNSDQHLTGLRNLVETPSEGKISDILEFLDNITDYKQHLLPSSDTQSPSSQESIVTIIGDENPVIPLGKGYAMVATKIFVENEEMVVGLVTPIQLLAKEKNLALMDALNKILGKKN